MNGFVPTSNVPVKTILMAIELTPEELRLFSSGDQLIFTRVYHAFEDQLYFYIIRLVKNEVDAHSLMIDVMCHLWLYRSSILSNEHIYNYLYLTATHKS